VRGYWVTEMWRVGTWHESEAGYFFRRVKLTSGRGGLRVWVGTGFMPRGSENNASFPTMIGNWRHFVLDPQYPVERVQRPNPPAWAGFQAYVGPRPPDHYVSVTAPSWACVAGFGILPAAWSARRARRRGRLKRGHCTACGYDLRATPGRCPECGNEPPCPRPGT